MPGIPSNEDTLILGVQRFLMLGTGEAHHMEGLAFLAL